MQTCSENSHPDQAMRVEDVKHHPNRAYSASAASHKMPYGNLRRDEDMRSFHLNSFVRRAGIKTLMAFNHPRNVKLLESGLHISP